MNLLLWLSRKRNSQPGGRFQRHAQVLLVVRRGHRPPGAGVPGIAVQAVLKEHSKQGSDTQKQEAVNSMISMTDIAEKETAAEILLEAKGFEDAIVSIDGGNVDVVVNTEELTEAQRAQIEDIVIRKTGVSAESIIISTVNAN